MYTRILVFLCLALAATACSAQPSKAAATQPAFTEGDQYVTIATPKRYASDGKVEVVEVFSYGCIHCAKFAPYMQKLAASLPAGVAVHYVPASFNPEWMPYARAFYAARELGVLKATHLPLFKAKFDLHYPLNSLDDLANFYAQQGVDRAAFLAAAQSAKTNRELYDDHQLVVDWGVFATPTIVVNGKYRSNNIRSYDELVSLVRWLVQRELKAGQP